MKAFIVSNTLFGYKNNNEEVMHHMIEYFNYEVLPFLKKNVKPGDVFIHGGNLFTNINLTSISSILEIKNVIEQIAFILPFYAMVNVKDIIEKDNKNIWHLFDKIPNLNIIDKNTTINNLNLIPFGCEYSNNSNLTLIAGPLKNVSNNIRSTYDINYDNINIGAPYQLKKDDVGQKRGMLVWDLTSGKQLFVENKTSPKFHILNIEKDDDLNNIQVEFCNKNYVDVIINDRVLETKDNKLKLMLSKFNIQNIIYKNNDEIIEYNNDIWKGNIWDTIEDKISGHEKHDELIDTWNEIKGLIKPELK